MSRMRSSSSSTPLRITCPLFTSCGGSGSISISSLSLSSLQASILSAISARVLFSDRSQASLIGCMQSRAFFSCTISRGDTRPVATFAVMRSRSPTPLVFSSMISLSDVSLKNSSTTSSRLFMSAALRNGKHTHLLSILAPIGEQVRSITSMSEHPPSCIERVSSSERTVKLSSLTYRSSSIRDSDVIWLICVCCVSSRYCRMAPHATIPHLRWSTPKPLRFFTSKCLCSFWRAVCSLNTHSSSSKVKCFVPKKRSKSAFLPLSYSTSFGWKLPISFCT
ncbi:unknown [Prevotella sp. CAG:592]|nr:unknown [Prevotella sp. CAG:592]